LDSHKDEDLFSFLNLAKLEKLGIRPSPRVKLSSKINNEDWWKAKANEPSDRNAIFRTDGRLQCFPWTIVEVKKPEAKEVNKTECYCQTLNSCSVALEMLERLHGSENLGSILPIVA
jgi:hypothetical protein